MTKKTIQKNIRAGGDVIGGDKTVIKYSPKSPMTSLIERYRYEITSDKSLKQYIDELAHYAACIDEDEMGMDGLMTKLVDSKREDLIDHAVRLKENFVKRLARDQSSRTAQEIYAYLLGDMLNRFRNQVWPLILDGASRTQIDSAVQIQVLDPIMETLEENVLRLSPADISGMKFFLTGNCHIRWAN